MFNVGSGDGRRGGGGGLPRVSITGVGGGSPGGGRSAMTSRGGPGGGSVGGAKASYVPKYSEQPHATDAVNQDILRRVKAKFDSADMDGSGRLHPQEFINAFLGILQTEDGGDAEALAKLFMRIDANSDGTVDWDEFSTYMLLESQGSAKVREFESTVTMQQAEPSPVPDLLAHKDAMTHIASMRLANGVDRYATCGRDGTVRLWNAKDLKHVKTLHLPRPRAGGHGHEGSERLLSAREGGAAGSSRPSHGNGGLWATCSAFMPLTQKLAVGSFSRSIRIYDLASYEVAGQIPEIDYVPLCLDVWVPPRAKDSELVVVGDGGGWVRLFELRSSNAAGGGDGDGKPGGGGGGSGMERLTERPRWRYHHHGDWVMAVKYVADMNCVLAASLDKTVSITDAEERVPLKKLEGHHTKGVNAVDWSSLYKFVATGSLDRRVIMWNPFSQKPLAVLSGHNAAVTGVVVNDRDNQIISLSTDHIIKIWDIRNHKCIQSLPDRELLNMGAWAQEDAVTPALYDSERRQLVTGYNRPKVWKMTTAGAGATKAHSAAVTRVIYNSNFSEAISADHAGTISVWHVPTGKLRYRFMHCHGDKRITALAFDAAKRRLMSGAEDGDCKIWNFSSGACLSALASRSKAEVTALVPLRGPLTRYVLAAGWDRRITFYEDNAAKSVGPSRTLAGHKADILAMVAIEGSSTVVTASDDGELWVWNMDSCAPKRRMLAPGTQQRPANERAVEALAFLSGGGGPGGSMGGLGAGPSRLRSVLVAVGADRWLRLWDVLDGALLAERFTGHTSGETVQALALDGSNSRIATGDSGGMIKVWDLSTYGGGPMSQATAAATIRELAVWRGHRAHVTSLDWVDAPAPPGRGGLGGGGSSRALYLVSSSADCTVALWTETGVRVGTFGQNTWSLDDPSTWADTERQPLDERDSWVMETSRAIPRTDPAAPTSVSATPEPPGGDGAEGASGYASAGPSPHDGPGSRPLHFASRPASASSEIALVCDASNQQRLDRRASLRRMKSRNAGGERAASSLGRVGSGALGLPAIASGVSLGAGGSGGAATVAAGGGVPRGSPYGGLALAMEGSVVGAPGAGPGPGPGGAWVGPGGARPGSGKRLVSVVARAEGLEDEWGSEEEGDGEGSSGSSSSDDHASDTEVPAALWLRDFDAARNSRITVAAAVARDAALAGGSGRGAYGAMGRMGVAHLLKTSELSMLQERPATSYMSSRKGVATAAGVLTQRASPSRPGTSGTGTRRGAQNAPTAGTSCGAILRAGVFNMIQRSASSTDFFRAHQAACLDFGNYTFDRYLQDTAGTLAQGQAADLNAAALAFKWFDASTGGTGPRLFTSANSFFIATFKASAYRDTACGNSTVTSENDPDILALSLFIDAFVLEAFTTCIALFNAGLRVVQTSGFGGTSVAFNIRFVPNTPGDTAFLNGLTIVPPGAATCNIIGPSGSTTSGRRRRLTEDTSAAGSGTEGLSARGRVLTQVLQPNAAYSIFCSLSSTAPANILFTDIFLLTSVGSAFHTVLLNQPAPSQLETLQQNLLAELARVAASSATIAARAVPVGTISAFASEAAPEDYLPCDGRAVRRADFPQLFAAIGTAFGAGDGTSTFNVPDLQGRGVIGTGCGAGLTCRNLGTKLGEEKHLLTVDEMPQHRHGIIDLGHSHQLVNFFGVDGGLMMSNVPLSQAEFKGGLAQGAVFSDGGTRGFARFGLNYRFTTATTISSISINPTGGNVPHNVMPPSLAMSYFIKARA
ncbi:hypothetical protein HYH03_011334 [Edaphochlamys debaryana]|uniref:EF-hand domain-containing protein n=1 Tax=Edaphochlamys debaryana TaxID=47281 RepID=A0A835XV31_9CHLO|nr:hypothetical protein HYH03_011334 [Edaphochlamys debaryana]|eukprot:KAG2490207.1 hypothetical protein HYH03_011334 [Edaphochlamys debaryana]